ncbi:glutaminase kidney isoform, mitochondrial isoform X2 [Mixophyes fleayi]|uniref:glutaminase kidney isoform, mitochondrial isoform X2 n=1 Tax=Mixophyes fleayi TaxID=3061075 RepID=UPI003F4D7B99
MDMLRLSLQTTSDGVMLDKDLFKKCVQSNIVLLTQAFRRKFVIPDFMSFTSHIDELFESAKKLSGGKVADYIPQLAKFSPDLWGVSICTVDGQRHSVGDTKVPFCLQSCVKPLKYAIAVNDLSTEYVHRYVGKEPSGLRFNKLFLNEDEKPHNPMVNAGAIVITSLIKQGSSNAEKFDYVMQFLNKMAGNEYVGFSNATFQSERESGDRNFAIGYYLKEKKCFPENTDMVGTLDFYFQLCSIEVTCESASVMAATLANGGFCPITGERVLSPEAVRNTLSLMHSCGMYDFSGQFAFHVGLPAKSGVSGGILLVVPNVMGMMFWSPPLDKLGNSVRGIQFCQDLVSLCNFHNYDNLRHFAKKLDPRREGGDQRVKSVINLLFAAFTGDVSALRRFALSAMDMEQRDYDSRTALHVASAEGHVEVVRFLLEACKVNPFPKDRRARGVEKDKIGVQQSLLFLQKVVNQKQLTMIVIHWQFLLLKIQSTKMVQQDLRCSKKPSLTFKFQPPQVKINLKQRYPPQAPVFQHKRCTVYQKKALGLILSQTLLDRWKEGWKHLVEIWKTESRELVIR